jgi:type II secretory pathway pseudopilin PulG
MYIFKIATGIAIAALGAVTYLGVQHAAQLSATASELHNVSASAQLARAASGSYPSTLSELSNPTCASDLKVTFGDNCDRATPIPANLDISYVANVEGTHYVLALKESSGKVYVASDTNPLGGECADYTSTCIAGVTADAELIGSTPRWAES